MSRVVVVILGAGASHDCRVPHTGRGNASDPRIPLTDGLFQSQGFHEIFDKYPGSALEGHIFTREGRRRTITLETHLKERLLIGDAGIRRHVLEIPLYLREYIGTLGRNIIKQEGRTGYSDLVDWLSISRPQYDRILFLTTNWDILLETALESVGMRFHNLESYIGHLNRWYLVKFHGSVSWIKQIPRGKAGGVTAGMSELDIMLGIDRKRVFFQDASVDISHNYTYTNGHEFLYPIMVVPVTDKKEHICPDAHLEAVGPLIAEAEDFMIIGNSMRDQDLCDYLRERAKSAKRLTVVDKALTSNASAEELLTRVTAVFPTAVITKRYNGFCQFVEGL